MRNKAYSPMNGAPSTKSDAKRTSGSKVTAFQVHEQGQCIYPLTPESLGSQGKSLGYTTQEIFSAQKPYFVNFHCKPSRLLCPQPSFYPTPSSDCASLSANMPLTRQETGQILPPTAINGESTALRTGRPRAARAPSDPWMGQRALYTC